MKELKLPYYRLLTHKYCRGGRLPEGQYLTAGGGSARTPYACKTLGNGAGAKPLAPMQKNHELT